VAWIEGNFSGSSSSALAASISGVLAPSGVLPRISAIRASIEPRRARWRRGP
jgi:hypothetical protein